MLYPDSVKTLKFSHYLLIKGDLFVLDDDKYPKDPRFEDPYNHVYAVEKPDAFGLFDDPVATGQRATTHEQQRLQDCSKTVYLEKGQYIDALNRNMPKLKKHLRNLYCSIS